MITLLILMILSAGTLIYIVKHEIPKGASSPPHPNYGAEEFLVICVLGIFVASVVGIILEI